MTVNKKFLAEGIVENYGVTKAIATKIVDHLFSVMTINLGLGNDVDINGFGKFVVAERAARTARNPINGQPVEVPAKLAVKFKPSKGLKDAMNNDDPLEKGETQY